MGSCVSVQKDSASAMKFRVSIRSKNDKLVSPSPIKVKPVANGGLKPQPGTNTFRDFGSNEETFFDSQPWLESDCEDDFFSVNGDFTPSRGSTPVHQSFSIGTPRRVLSKSPFGEKASGSLPPEPSSKKRLSDLFKESLRGDRNSDGQIATGNKDDQNVQMKLPSKFENDTPYYVCGPNFLCSTERTPDGGSKTGKSSVKSAQCCLPRLRPDRNYSERKKRTSP